MCAEDIYTLKEVKIAFFRYFRGGGELKFKDSWTVEEGSIIVDWEGFLEELEKTEGRNQTASESL